MKNLIAGAAINKKYVKMVSSEDFTHQFYVFSLQLDSQSRETERLQRQLYDDATGGYRPVTSVRSALADLEIPITSHMSTTRVGSFPGSRGAETDFLAT